MATRSGRKIAHYAAGGGALPTDATAQGMPAATPALGYTPGPNTNAAGSWGAGAESGGIAGDSSISPVGAAPAWTGPSTAGDYVPPPPPMPAAAPNVAATPTPTPTPAAGSLGGGVYASMLPSEGGFKEGGAIPDVEHFAGGGRSGHGGYKTPSEEDPGYDPNDDMVAKFNKQASTHVSRRFTDQPETDQPQSAVPDNENADSGKSPPMKQPPMGGQQPKQSQQPSGASTPSSQPALPDADDSGTSPSGDAAAPTDAMGSPGWSGGLDQLPAGSSAGQGGAATDAMGSVGAAAGAAAGAAMAKGGSVLPTEEPYREKWRAKNDKKQTPYRAFADGGAIPDTADVPVDEDQGQEGQAGDLYAQVKQVLSQTRQQYGLTDKAFQMAGNMPTVPGSQSSGSPPRFPLPAGVPGSGGFGTKGSLSQNDNNDQELSAADGGAIGSVAQGAKTGIDYPPGSPEGMDEAGLEAYYAHGDPKNPTALLADGGAIPAFQMDTPYQDTMKKIQGKNYKAPEAAKDDSENTSTSKNEPPDRPTFAPMSPPTGLNTAPPAVGRGRNL